MTLSMNIFPCCKKISIEKIHRYKMVNQYLFLRKLGFGSTSKAYLAKDNFSSENVAIKVIHFDPTKNSNFVHQVIHEMKIFSQMNHPNIIQLKKFFCQKNSKEFTLSWNLHHLDH
jgi:serine/threonine protein kinase